MWVFSPDKRSPRVPSQVLRRSWASTACSYAGLKTTRSRVKEWLSDGRRGLSVAAGFPWQCLTSPVMIGSPSPSHPTVRAVFPSTAVRQSSSYPMRRFRFVLEQAAAKVGKPHRLQLAVRKALPSETPAFASLGQVPAKTNVDEALKPSEGLAGVGMTEVVDPPHHHRIHHVHELLRTDGRSSRRHILQAVPNVLLSRLGWENVDGLLPAPGT